MRKVLANIISGLIPGRQNRHVVRVRLKTPIHKYVRFVKTFSKAKHPVVRYTYGHRCINFVVTLDDKYVFKFPIGDDGWNISKREKRITDALRPISPIKIPKMEIFDCDGVAVRRYEYIAGIGFHALDQKTQRAHAGQIAKQLAKFLYVVGSADPREIRDLKPKQTVRPGMMCGWNNTDLWDNFIINPKTFDVVAMIDWEGAAFREFYSFFTSGTRQNGIKQVLLREYLKLYANKKQK